MKKYWIYFKYLLKHKFYIWEASKIYPIPYYLILLHDIDKFDPICFYHYANYYYGNDAEKRRVTVDYQLSEYDHTISNKHHWLYWNYLGAGYDHEIPDKYINEMLCDWYASSMAKYGKDNTKEWYRDKNNDMIFHSNTRKKIEKILYD